MSVPAWRQDESKTEFIRQLIELNILVGHIVMDKKTRKYKPIYGEHIAKQSLRAMDLAETANCIMLNKSTTETDYGLRRSMFQESRGVIQSLSTSAYIFLELVRDNHDQPERWVDNYEKRIGSKCANISRLLTGVIKSDQARWKEFHK